MQQLFKFRDEMRTEPTPPEGITSAERPFYNLCIEVMLSHADEDNAHQEAKKFSINTRRLFSAAFAINSEF